MHRPFLSEEKRALQAAFESDGVLRIPNFVAGNLLERCGKTLPEVKGWHTAVSDCRSNVQYFDPAFYQPGTDLQIAVSAARQSALDDFQLHFDLVELTEAGQEYLPEPWRDLREFLLGKSFRHLIEELTAPGGRVSTDGIVSRHARNHFFGLHWDRTKIQGRARLMAYLLCPMAYWGVDWGGSTLLWNTELTEALAIRPVFNSLTLFSLPRPHSVEPIADFVTKHRVMISGFVYLADRNEGERG